jgi:hypothetical protein
MQTFFIDPATPFNQSELGARPVWQVGSRSFAASLGQLLNTFWIASVGLDAITQGDPGVYRGDADPAAVNFGVAAAPAVRTVEEVVMACHAGWLAALVVATAAVLAAAALNVALGCAVCVPSLAWNVATLSRDGRCFDVPNGGSGVSDGKRSEGLDRVRVRFGDVCMGEAVGRLAVGNEQSVARFRRGRAYM